jgi:hypothetical protein
MSIQSGRPAGRALAIMVAGALLAATGIGAKAQKQEAQFERISTFLVCQNSSCDRSQVANTFAEIVTATSDGKTLLYVDGGLEGIGFVDITDPANPRPLGVVPVGGEPTSVTVAGKYALAGVNTSVSFVNPSGNLAVFDIEACLASIGGCAPLVNLDLQGQPDSVAVSPDGRYAAVAIENERDEDLVVQGVQGGLPQFPPGFLVIVDLVGMPNNWKVRNVDMTGLADIAPDDPEPEYVAINRANIAAVTLQENNHVVLVHLPTGKVLNDFNAGTVTLEHIDTVRNSLIEFNNTLVDIRREPDAIAWLGEGRVVTANEGDFVGGSRGFSIFDRSGKVLYDSGVDFEYLAVRHGHYPEPRARNKGAEPEAVEVARFGNREYIFVGSERGNFVAVYVSKGNDPEFLQLLPTGVSPEGTLAIPQRNLFVVATENDSAVRAQINIFELKQGPASYPTIVSGPQTSGPVAGKAPIAWGALSALAGDRNDPGLIYGVHDSFYVQSRIYRMDVRQVPALIVDEIVLKKNGATVNYDLEGLVQRANGGFWAVSEGAGDAPNVATRNLLIEVAADGAVLQEIRLPASVEARQVRFGFEGVAVEGAGADEKVYVAFQREWQGDPTGYVRIGVYTPATGEWGFFIYPLDAVESPAGGWVGLSEIVALGNGRFATIERDNQGGPDARIKRIYVFSTAGVTPQPEGSAFQSVTKFAAIDMLPLMQATNGWVLDKLEGLTVAADGEVYAVTDNDGLSSATGETQFFRLGRVLH